MVLVQKWAYKAGEVICFLKWLASLNTYWVTSSGIDTYSWSNSFLSLWWGRFLLENWKELAYAMGNTVTLNTLSEIHYITLQTKQYCATTRSYHSLVLDIWTKRSLFQMMLLLWNTGKLPDFPLSDLYVFFVTPEYHSPRL